MKTDDYKFNEDEYLDELQEYIDDTYDAHYSKDREFQALEFIIDSGHGIGFTIGDIMKYAQRYGHKGTPENWRKDLMKIIHYGMLALYIHDKEHGDSLEESEDEHGDVNLIYKYNPPLYGIRRDFTKFTRYGEGL